MKKIKLQNLVFITLVISFGVFFLANNSQAAYGVDGSYLQVKTADEPIVYYLDHARGLKKAYVNEKSFLAYGNAWSDIKVIDESLITDWPDIRLVKSAKSPTVYYIHNNKKSAIKSAADFIKFGFKWSEIIVINQTDLEQYLLISNSEIGLKSASGKARITLDSGSPAAKRLPTSTNNNLVAIFDFESPDKLNQITSLTLNIVGAYNNSAVKGVYLTDEMGKKITGVKSLKDRAVTFNLGNNTINVEPGRSVKIRVYINMNDCVNCSNNSLRVEISQSGDIVSLDSFGGNYPLKANTMSIVYATPYIGNLSTEEKALNETELIVGMSSQVIGQYKISELSDREDVIIKSITFRNQGSAKPGDVQSCMLKDGRNKKLAAAVSFNDNKELKFNFNNLVLEKEHSQKLTVVCDIVDGHDRTINLDLVDIEAEGARVSFNVSADTENINETLVIKRNNLGVSSKELSVNRHVFSEQEGVIIGVFEIKNNNKTIEVERFEFSLERSGRAPRLEKYVYVVDYDTGKTLYIIDADDFYSGSVRIEISPFVLKDRRSMNIALVADMPEDFRNGEFYQINFNNIYYKGRNDRYYTDEVNVSGTKLIFSKSQVYAYPNNEEGSLVYIKGQKKVKVAGFILESSAGEDVVIESLTLSKTPDSDVISYDNGFSNMYIKIGNKRSKKIDKPYSGTNTFENIDYKLKGGRRVEVKVYVDTVAELSVDKIELKILSLVARSNVSNSPSYIANLDTTSHKTVFGEVGAKLEMLSGGSIVGGEIDNEVATFTITNTGIEDVKLGTFILETSSDGFTYSHGYQNLEVYSESGKRLSRIREPVAGANELNLNGYTIEPSEKIEFKILVDAGEDPPSGDFDMYISNIRARGSVSKVYFNLDGDPSANTTVAVN